MNVYLKRKTKKLNYLSKKLNSEYRALLLGILHKLYLSLTKHLVNNKLNPGNFLSA